MKKAIREYTPFIMLSYSLLFALCANFDFYFTWYIYLPDLLGYSIFTSIFMISVYMNRSYCASTKICVWGLIILNICNMVYNTFDIRGYVYDIYLILTIFLVLILKR